MKIYHLTVNFILYRHSFIIGLVFCFFFKINRIKQFNFYYSFFITYAIKKEFLIHKNIKSINFLIYKQNINKLCHPLPSYSYASFFFK